MALTNCKQKIIIIKFSVLYSFYRNDQSSLRLSFGEIQLGQTPNSKIGGNNMSKAITDATFASETDEGLVLIDFWATWCGPCRMQAPILDQLAASHDEDELKIVKMDVDENPETPAQFGVMSIPTLLLKKDGEVVDKVIGVHTKDQLEQLIATHL